MPEWLWLILTTLGVYVCARTFTREEGAWGMFSAWRAQTGRWASSGKPVAVFIADVFHCAYCLSGYFSLAAGALYTLHYGTGSWIMTTVLVWFGVFGAVTVLLVFEDRGQ